MKKHIFLMLSVSALFALSGCLWKKRIPATQITLETRNVKDARNPKYAKEVIEVTAETQQ